jgi:flagellar biosynthetic protein FliR
MNLLPQPYEAWFMTFFFVYVRVSAAVFVLPIIGNESVLPAVRAGLAFWIAVVLMGPLWGLNAAETNGALPAATQVYSGLLGFGIAVMGEVLIGFALGFIAQLLLQTIGMAGEIIGQQAGFSAASVFDPITGQDIFLMEQITILIATLIFILIGGVETSLQVLADSFRVVGPGEGFSLLAYSDAGWFTLLYDEERRFALVNLMFKVAIQVAAPIMVAMILISVAEGFIARIVPQLNILVVGFAVRLAISLMILAGMMRHLFEHYSQYLMQYSKYAGAFLQRLAAG